MGVASTIDSCCVSATASLAAADTVIAYITLDDRPTHVVLEMRLLNGCSSIFQELHTSGSPELHFSVKPARSEAT